MSRITLEGGPRRPFTITFDDVLANENKYDYADYICALQTLVEQMAEMLKTVAPRSPRTPDGPLFPSLLVEAPDKPAKCVWRGYVWEAVRKSEAH